jgi:hypothetical protein
MCNEKKTQPQTGGNTQRRQAPQGTIDRRKGVEAVHEDDDRKAYQYEDDEDDRDDEDDEDDEGGKEDDAVANVGDQSPTAHGADPKPAITQAMLKRIMRHKKEAREVEPLIRQIKRAVADGAAIEPGSCTLKVRTCKIPYRLPKLLIQALRLSSQRVAELEAAGGAKEGVVAVIREYGEVLPFGE